MGRHLGLSSTLILAALEARVRYGLDITQRTGLLPGTVYTTLRRLEKRELVCGEWEAPDIAEVERRPRRRYYSLTPSGEVELAQGRARLAALPFGFGVPAADGVESE